MSEPDSNPSPKQPIKRRRGRPPKFFAVWTSQYLIDKLYNMDTPPIFAQPVGEEKVKTPEPDPYKFEIKEEMQEPNSEEPSQNDVSEHADETRERQNSDPCSEDSKTGSDSCFSEALSPVFQSVEHSPINPTDVVEGPIEDTEDNNNNKLYKRRPGRPRGTYKKKGADSVGKRSVSTGELPSYLVEGQHQSGQEQGQDVQGATDALSPLKQFYELGGRDYEAFIKWREARACALNHFSSTMQAPPSINKQPGLSTPYIATTHVSIAPSLSAPITARSRQTWFPPVAVRPSITDTFRYRRQSSPQAISKEEAVDLSVNRKRKVETVYPSQGVLKRHGFEKSHDGHDMDKLRKECQDMNTNVSPLAVSRLSASISGWTVEQVARFVSSVPHCQEYAEVFRVNFIDGTTLPFITEHHMLHVFGMKLGPAIGLQRALALKAD